MKRELKENADHKVSALMDASREQAQAHWLSFFFKLVFSAWIALLFACLINLFVYNMPHQDQSSYLCWAQRAMSGAQIYGPDIVESNPPLIIWFSTIPMFLAHLLHPDPLSMLKLVVAIMIVGSVAWSGRILRAVLPAASSAFFYLALCSLLSAEILVHGFDVGQREHLLFILVLPYVLSAACGARAKLPFVELCAIGAIGGIAVCFKPQQVVILIGLEIFLAVWSRSLRRLASPDFLCAVLAVFAYVALVRMVTPYFSTMVPVLKETYWAFGQQTALQLIRAKARFELVLLLALIVFVWRRRQLRFAAVSGSFLACSLAALFGFCIQHTGWTYQAYPFQAFLLAAVLWITLDSLLPFVKSQRIDLVFAVSALVFTLALFVPMIILHMHEAARNAADKSYVETIFARYPPQTPVSIFSTSLDGFPAVTEDHLVWANRFAHLWMLPAIIQNESAEAGGPAPGKVLPPDAVAQLAALQRTETTEDLRRWKPAVVIVRQCRKSAACQGMPGLDFDFVAWFLQSPEFAAEWRNYRLKEKGKDFDVYTRIR